MQQDTDKKKEIIIDMSTGDPDDFLSLLLLLGHPEVSVKAVTLTPGNDEQIGLIKKALHWFNLDVPIGAFDINYEKSCVPEWYTQTFGKIKRSRDAYTAPDLLVQIIDPGASLFCGSALNNISAAIKLGQDKNKHPKAKEVFIQGGYAGPELTNALNRPDNLQTKHSENLEKDKKAAWSVIKSKIAPNKYFISENICQDIYYTAETNELLSPLKKHNLSLALIWKAMDRYFKKHRKPKRISKLFAACCTINPEIVKWKEVEIIRKNKGWGSLPSDTTECYISTDYNQQLFEQTLCQY